MTANPTRTERLTLTEDQDQQAGADPRAIERLREIAHGLLVLEGEAADLLRAIGADEQAVERVSMAEPASAIEEQVSNVQLARLTAQGQQRARALLGGEGPARATGEASEPQTARTVRVGDHVVYCCGQDELDPIPCKVLHVYHHALVLRSKDSGLPLSALPSEVLVPIEPKPSAAA